MIVLHRDIIEDGKVITYEVKVRVLTPITKDDKLELGAGSYMLQNVGSEAAILDDGWTMLSGAHLSLKPDSDLGKVTHTFKVRFDNTIGNNTDAPYTGKRLEIMETFTRICNITSLYEYMNI